MLRITILLGACLGLYALEPGPGDGYWAEAEITAYCPCTICCGAGARGITATGLRVESHPYGIAADPDLLPYGTRIVFGAGDNPLCRLMDRHALPRILRVDDTGGAVVREGHEHGILRLDVRVRLHRTAVRIGRFRMRVFIEERAAGDVTMRGGAPRPATFTPRDLLAAARSDVPIRLALAARPGAGARATRGAPTMPCLAPGRRPGGGSARRTLLDDRSRMPVLAWLSPMPGPPRGAPQAGRAA
jgi:3D (Asp-Asp-Asp) domain-containing protein